MIVVHVAKLLSQIHALPDFSFVTAVRYADHDSFIHSFVCVNRRGRCVDVRFQSTVIGFVWLSCPICRPLCSSDTRVGFASIFYASHNSVRDFLGFFLLADDRRRSRRSSHASRFLSSRRLKAAADTSFAETAYLQITRFRRCPLLGFCLRSSFPIRRRTL